MLNSEPNIFTIPTEKLPSKAFSVSFKEPLFKDRREVSRRFPASNTRAGYSVEELLLASCLTGINDQPLPAVPRDPIQYLQDMPHLDAQYLLSVFLGMFTLDNEMADQAKELGLQFKTSLSGSYTIPKDAMPLQEYSVTFRPPSLGDRMEVDRRYPGADSNCGYSIEEMLFASSLIALEGASLEKPKDPIAQLDDWKHLDAQFAMAVFINTVTIDTAESQDARTLGKSLRAELKTTTTAASKGTPKKGITAVTSVAGT